jgi:hypothetical protein
MIQETKSSALNNVNFVFRLDQRVYDITIKSSIEPIMLILADQLNCNLLTFKYKLDKETAKVRGVYSMSITSPMQLFPLI